MRTGRASSALVEKLKVEVYGSEVPLQQIAGFGVPEPRVLTISPYDKSIDQGDREGDPAERPRRSTRRTTGRSSAWCSRSSPRSAARTW